MKVGIIGAGKISDTHVESYKAIGAEVIAITDRSPDSAKAKAEKYDIPRVYDTLDALLADTDVEAVSIATPVSTHKELAVAALRAGKHVICEKPPAMAADDIREMIAARDASGKVLMFGFVCRFKRRLQALREAYQSGRLGRVIVGEAGRLARNANPGSWFSDRRFTQGGPFFDAAIHEIDELFYILGYPKLHSVRAVIGYDNSDLSVRLSSVKQRYVSESKGDFNNDVETSVTVFALTEDGVPLILRATSATGTVEEGPYVKLTCANGGGNIVSHNAVPLALLTLDADGFHTEEIAESGKPFDAQLAHFRDCVENGAAPIANAEEALALMEFYDAVYQSAAEGREILL